MIGIGLGMLLLASCAGTPPVLDNTVLPAAPAVVVEDDAGPTLKLPRILVDDPLPGWRLDSPQRGQAAAAPRTSTAAKIIGTAVGALGGFWAGGAIGFYTAQDPNADDDGVSGLRGVVIGAPIGALVGAVIGYQVAK